MRKPYRNVKMLVHILWSIFVLQGFLDTFIEFVDVSLYKLLCKLLATNVFDHNDRYGFIEEDRPENASGFASGSS